MTPDLTRDWTRAEDERLLHMLALRLGGASVRVIGRTVGLRFGYVGRMTDAVAAADLAESGELPLHVAAAYAWPRRTPLSGVGA